MDSNAPPSHALDPIDAAASALKSDRWSRFRSLASAPLPLPGRGRTLERWRTFAELAASDLVLAKVYESHADAVAILADLDATPAGGAWAVFAAEPPGLALVASGEPLRLDGKKAWCSAAARVEHALVTCTDATGGRRLVTVDFRERGITLEPTAWASAGMAGTETIDVVFDDVACAFVGGDRAYLDRPGFWHGAIGVAACWYGAALGLARVLRTRCTRGADVHAWVHLGAIDASLRASAAALRAAAHAIDARPHDRVLALALACRATVERTVEEVLVRCGHALGAGPLCRDAAYAERVQDLAVFVRQSHAERDLAALGECCAASDDEWAL